MRNLLAFAALALIVFAVVGYYQSWYAFEETTSLTGEKSYRVVFFTNKMKADEQKVKEEVVEMFQKK